MLDATITHYFPWDESDDFAVCGAPMTDANQHRTLPSCPACRAILHQHEDDATRDLRVELGRLRAIVTRLAKVYTVDTDQAALIGLVRDAQKAVAS